MSSPRVEEDRATAPDDSHHRPPAALLASRNDARTSYDHLYPLGNAVACPSGTTYDGPWFTSLAAFIGPAAAIPAAASAAANAATPAAANAAANARQAAPAAPVFGSAGYSRARRQEQLQERAEEAYSIKRELREQFRAYHGLPSTATDHPITNTASLYPIIEQ